MRFIDRFIGIPLCWILGVAYSLVRPSSSQDTTRKVRTILVVKFFGMGSILIATSAISCIKREFPYARLLFVSFRENRELLERVHGIDDVLTIDRSSPAAFTASLFLAVRTIVLSKPGIYFDFEFFSKLSTLLAGISRAPIRVGFQLPARWRSMIITHHVPLNKQEHVRYAFHRQIEAVVGHPCTLLPVVPPSTTKDDHRTLLAKLPIEGKRIVAININAGETFPERRWPSLRFSQLVSRLSSEADADFCFIGGADDTKAVREAIADTGCPHRCIDAAGKLTIPELSALLLRSDILISNDSGPLHLAATLDVPVVGLYGPESPEFYGPVSERATNIYKRTSCSPCMNIYAAKQFRCPYNALCMREITVDEVLRHVQSHVLVAS